MQLANEFGLDPWEDIGRWTWPQIWLAINHLEDESAYMKAMQEKARREAKVKAKGQKHISQLPGLEGLTRGR